MSYIVQRQARFYVVAYDGLDPLTARERRRWHPVGHDRDEAEQLAARLDRERDATPAAPTGPVTFGEFLTNTWIPLKRRQVRATTAYRYRGTWGPTEADRLLAPGDHWFEPSG